MRFRISMLAVPLALAACRAPAPAFRPDDPAVAATIDSIMQRAVEAAGKADADGVMRIADGPGDFTFITGDVMLDGADRTRQAFKATYATVDHQQNTIETKRVRMLSPDVALFTAVGEGTYTDRAGWTSPPVGMGLTIVFVRTNGRWQAVHAHQSIAP